MSDSEGALPSESAISQKLRDVVIALHKAGNADDLTVKRVRARAEKELGLPEGYLKTNTGWKQKSQDAIHAAVEKYCTDEPAPEPTPKKVVAKPKAKAAPKKTKEASEGTKGVKRKAAAPAKKPKKRRKTDSDDDLESELSEPLEEEPSDAESEPPQKLARRGKRAVAEDSDDEDTKKPAKPARKAVEEDESDGDAVAAPTTKAQATPPHRMKGDVSESELSSLIDESPKPKSRGKKATKAANPSKAKAKAAKPKAADDPDTAEIKHLQGWLVKCGIRKVWSRDPELSKCDTSKEKISLLKGMLKDVGMDGKYSVEKAAKIKERREFAKDLAAIQEAEAHWGTAASGTSGRPTRRAAAAAATKPMQKLVLSDDSEDADEDGREDKESSGGDDDDDDDDDDVQSGPASDEKNDSGDDDSD